MTKEGVLKHKKVFDAWLEGAEVEYKCRSGEWCVSASKEPKWYEDTEYRIKSEPLEVWVNIYELSTCVHKTKERALESAQTNCVRAAVRMVEAPEQDNDDNYALPA